MSKNKEYVVQIPITGYLIYTVEATDESSAIEKAWNRYDEGDHGEELAWEAISAVTTGNVSHALLNEVCAQCTDKT